jgi:o-succinylbenzoate synthase
MKVTIDEIRLIPFSYTFKNPMRVGSELLTTREGYHLQAKADNCHQAFGELSPLPGLALKPLTVAHHQIERVITKLPITIDLSLPMVEQFPDWQLLPSVSYALEECAVNLLYQSNPPAVASMFHLPSDAPLPSCPLNALWIPNECDLEQIDLMIDEWASGGFRSVKMKIGRLKLEVEQKLLHQLIKRIKERESQLTIRLDGNCSMTSAQLVLLLEGIKLDLIEYVEEPLPDHTRHRSIHERLGVKWAVDETLQSCLKNNHFPTGCTTWVVKPRLLGSIAKCRQLIEQANQQGYQVVISSIFESSVGMDSLYLLAHLQNHYRPVPAGLDTLKEFA